MAPPRKQWLCMEIVFPRFSSSTTVCTESRPRRISQPAAYRREAEEAVGIYPLAECHSYPGLDYRRASAAYLCHFAEDDPFEPTESVAEMEQALQVAGRQATFYTYPGTNHWFFEENRPEYDAEAARVAWERTTQFLHDRLE